MVVARAIFDSEGRILLHSGIALNENYIMRLASIGIASVYIQDEDFGDTSVPDIISEATRSETVRVVKQGFQTLEKERKLNVRLVKHVVDNIIDELLANYNVLIHLSDIRAFDDYTFAHSVNVCILSIMAGITMGYHELKLKELGLGALLHDVGKIRIDSDILNKPDDLTREEYAEVKHHTEYGFEMLRQQEDVPLLSAHIAYQHHERWDGQGYPRNLSGTGIHEYARIVAVADVYDALMADRPYRPSYSLNQTLNIVKRMSGIHLDPDCVTALMANIAVYQIGTIVELSTGDMCVVVDVNKDYPTRPVVRVVYDQNARRINQPHEVDLSKLSTIVVRRSLTNEQIENLRNPHLR